MAFDYVSILLTARELITEFGRSVALRVLDSSAPDPAMPWRGPTNPRTAAVSQQFDAVFVEPSSLQKLGVNTDLLDWLPRAQQVAIIAHPGELVSFHELVDTDTSIWRIVGVSMLKPALVPLLHYVGVSR